MINEGYLPGELKGIHEGVEIASRIIGTTFGYYGKPVIIQLPDNKFLSVDDGATVARALKTYAGTQEQEIGCAHVLAACERVVQTVGDGTTTTALFVDAFLRFYLDNPNLARTDVVNDFIKNVDVWVDNATKRSTDESTLARVAALTTGEDDLSKICAQAVTMAGDSGLVLLAQGEEATARLEVKEGFSFYQEGTTHASLFLSGSKSIKVNEMNVFVYNGLLDTEKKMADVYQSYMKAIPQADKRKLLLIICSGVVGEAQRFMFENNRTYNESKGSKSVGVIAAKMPNWAPEELLDLLTCLNLRLIGEGGTPIQRVDHKQDFGEVLNVEATRNGLSFNFNDAGNKRKLAHLQFLEDEGVTGARLSRLRVGTITVVVGGNSDAQKSRFFELAQDGVIATQSAQRFGVAAGAGYTWMALAEAFPEYGSVFSTIVLKLFKEKAPDALDAFNSRMQYDLRTMAEVPAETFLEPANLFKEVVRVAATTGSELALAGEVLVWKK